MQFVFLRFGQFVRSAGFRLWLAGGVELPEMKRSFLYTSVLTGSDHRQRHCQSWVLQAGVAKLLMLRSTGIGLKDNLLTRICHFICPHSWHRKAQLRHVERSLTSIVERFLKILTVGSTGELWERERERGKHVTNRGRRWGEANWSSQNSCFAPFLCLPGACYFKLPEPPRERALWRFALNNQVWQGERVSLQEIVQLPQNLDGSPLTLTALILWTAFLCLAVRVFGWEPGFAKGCGRMHWREWIVECHRPLTEHNWNRMTKIQRIRIGALLILGTYQPIMSRLLSCCVMKASVGSCRRHFRCPFGLAWRISLDEAFWLVQARRVWRIKTVKSLENWRACPLARIVFREADWAAKQCKRYVATKDYGSPGHDRVLLA